MCNDPINPNLPHWRKEEIPKVAETEDQSGKRVEGRMTMRDIHIWWFVVISSGLIGTFAYRHLVWGLLIGILIASHIVIAMLFIRDRKEN